MTVVGILLAAAEPAQHIVRFKAEKTKDTDLDKLSIGVALRTLAEDETYKRFIEKADFDVGMYRPGETDDQSPHAREEIYIVAAGTGDFVCAGERERFVPGDAFFVRAGVEHRFENFSNDFSAWVVFIGARK